MLTELGIRDLGVIEDARLELAPGLTAVTGETGAGKTMIVTGLGLLLGQRADAGLIRRGQTSARVEGHFTELGRHSREQARELGAELDETEGAEGDEGDAEILVSRTIRKGRSRSHLGGAAVPTGVAAEFTSDLLTIHGQSEQVRLGRPERQREILDRSGGEPLAEALAEYRELWETRRRIAEELTDVTENAAERARELDMLKFGLDEIEAVAPQPGEDAELLAEATRLQDVDALRLACSTALVALSGDADDIDGACALTAAATAQKALSEAADPELAAMATRAGEISALAADLASDLASYNDSLAADPARLDAIMARQADLNALTRKYGNTIDEVLTWAETSAARAAQLDAGSDRVDELRARLLKLDEQLRESGARLSDLRRGAAQKLSDAVTTELEALALPHARLFFALDRLPQPGPHGLDQITLMFTANPGSEPRPLAKAASGGELSRVRLALEVVLAGDEEGGTFVFDEVDAGIGGAVAIEVGRRLARLAEHSQVIVVTHLAQVAAFADTHHVVVKSSDGAVTTSGVTAVADDDRAAELARMMAGMEDSETALAHARELLNQART